MLDPNCIFCKIIDRELPATIVDETEHTLTFFDIRPLFPGHCLIVPRQHYETLADLPDHLLKPLIAQVQKISEILPLALNSQGTFVANNNIVSQSVPHLHFHVVPRVKGDGLKGFFWPRRGYKNDDHREEVAQSIRSALKQL